MNDEKTTHEPGRTAEGEYLGGAYRYDDPAEAVNEIMEDVSRFIAENPKKTTVIVVASLTAGVVAAVTAAVATAAFMFAEDLKKSLRQYPGKRDTSR